MPLSDDELRDVLTRAEQIQLASRRSNLRSAELESVIAAAEEIGLERSAVERALRERLGLPAEPPAVGELCFARSADGNFYVAEVLSSSDDGLRVRFLRGAEHVVSPADIRPCQLLPGQRVVCNWPMWGKWTCTVVAFDADRGRVKLSDGWGSTKKFQIDEIWLPPQRRSDEARGSRARIYVRLVGAGLAIGALLGSLVTALVVG